MFGKIVNVASNALLLNWLTWIGRSPATLRYELWGKIKQDDERKNAFLHLVATRIESSARGFVYFYLSIVFLKITWRTDGVSGYRKYVGWGSLDLQKSLNYVAVIWGRFMEEDEKNPVEGSTGRFYEKIFLYWKWCLCLEEV